MFWQQPAHQTHLGSCASGQRKIVINYTDTYGLFDGQEAVTHPSSGGSVPADVGKSLLVVPVWCTEGHFLYSLVNNHTLQKIRATLDIRSFHSSCFSRKSIISCSYKWLHFLSFEVISFLNILICWVTLLCARSKSCQGYLHDNCQGHTFTQSLYWFKKKSFCKLDQYF